MPARCCRTSPRALAARWLLAAGLALGGSCAQAGADPLKSPACAAALARLQAAQADGQPDAVVAARRRQAAHSCLGQTGPPARRAPIQAPLQVLPALPPVTPTPAPPAPPPRMPPPPPVPQRAATLTHCDAAGCWVEEGQGRLRHVPRQSLAPPGLCPAGASALLCP